MDPRRRRRFLWVLVVLLLLSSSVGTMALMGPNTASGPIVINPGVILRPSQSWVDVGFSTQQSFSSQVVVRATAVILDNVSIGLQKIPLGLPRATMTITTWAPTAGNGSTAIEFLASSASSTTVSFNVTGLRPDMAYRIYVDGIPVIAGSALGVASFSWSTWQSSHTFDVTAYVPSAPGPPLPDITPPAQVTDLHAVAWGLDYAILSWTAPGNNGSVGQASQYDARYGPGGKQNATAFFNGTHLSTGAPQPAGSTETLNVTNLSAGTQYWFAIRTADAVPNWSPISNVVTILTLTSWIGVPTVSSVSVNATSSLVEIVFSEAMNHTSVEQSINITPPVPYDVEWKDDSHLEVTIHTIPATNATYLLRISPEAADAGGTPMARTFTFKFSGPTQTPARPGPLGLPWAILVPLVTILVGLAVTTTVTTVWVHQTRRRMRALEGAVQALTRRTVVANLMGRFRELRERVVAPVRGGSRRDLPGRGKK